MLFISILDVKNCVVGWRGVEAPVPRMGSHCEELANVVNTPLPLRGAPVALGSLSFRNRVGVISDVLFLQAADLEIGTAFTG
jgi:hypothetical protein